MKEWKDVTSYSQGDKERIPTCFEYRTPYLRIVIVWGHRSYPDTWVATCHNLGIDTKDLHLDSYDKIDYAKEKALVLVEKTLQDMIDSL